MRIIVIGAGGVGGYFGARLARAGEDVTFVARGAHLAAMRRDGLRVRSAVDGEWTVPVVAVADLDDVAPADLVLLCVKSYDTEAALDRAAPVVAAQHPVALHDARRHVAVLHLPGSPTDQLAILGSG